MKFAACSIKSFALISGLFPDASSAIPIIIASVENEDLYPNFRRCMYLTRLTRWAWTDPDMVPELESAVSQ